MSTPTYEDLIAFAAAQQIDENAEVAGEPLLDARVTGDMQADLDRVVADWIERHNLLREYYVPADFFKQEVTP